MSQNMNITKRLNPLLKIPPTGAGKLVEKTANKTIITLHENNNGFKIKFLYSIIIYIKAKAVITKMCTSSLYSSIVYDLHLHCSNISSRSFPSVANA